eukprot:5718077-Amphidinium_carterae.1
MQYILGTAKLTRRGSATYPLSWTSRRQTLTAASAPEAEVAALAESLMPGIVLQDACRVSHIVRSANPILKLNTYTDSAVALRQLRNQKVTVRSRTFANKFHYIRDLCYGTASTHKRCCSHTALALNNGLMDRL